MLEPHTVLRHDGVRLRRWRTADALVIHELVNSSLAHLAPWMPFAANGYTHADARSFLQQCERDWADRCAYNYAIITGRGDLAGSCGLMARGEPGTLEIGYWLAERHTGQGIATRAAAALLAEAYRMGAGDVVIVHDGANTRSALVPSRLNFTEIARTASARPVDGGRCGVEVTWRHTRLPAA